MEKVKAEVGFQGTRAQFFEHLRTDPKFKMATREALTQGYYDIGKKVDAKLGELEAEIERLSGRQYAYEPDAIARSGVVQLQRWGLLDRVVAAGTPPVTKVVFHYPDEITEVSLKPAAGVEALYAPRRNILDPLLADAATEAGAPTRFAVPVIR